MPTGYYKRAESKLSGHRVGNKRSPTYNSWRAMKSRCLSVSNRLYARYGGSGITICKRWLDFNEFLADMGECPKGKTIDRINNRGNYEPGNCRWATSKEQRNNRGDSILITAGMETLNTVEWSARLGLSRTVVAQRINRGWAHYDAATIPPLRGSRTLEWYKTSPPRTI